MSRKKRTDTPSYVVASGAVFGAAAGIFVGSPSLLSSGFTGSVLFMVVPITLGFSLLGAWLAAMSQLPELDESYAARMWVSTSEPPRLRGLASSTEDNPQMDSGVNHPEAA